MSVAKRYPKPSATFDIEEAAVYLDVTADWLYRNPPHKGGPPRVKRGGRNRYYPEDLDRWLYLQRETPPDWADAPASIASEEIPCTSSPSPRAAAGMPSGVPAMAPVPASPSVAAPVLSPLMRTPQVTPTPMPAPLPLPSDSRPSKTPSTSRPKPARLQLLPPEQGTTELPPFLERLRQS